MARNSCIAVPEAPNGKPSRMYQDLLKTIKDRPQANWVYSCYLASNAADAMERATDANGNPLYRKNSQGEFNAKDVLKFIDYASMQREMSDLTLAEQQLGAVDSNGVRVDFANAKEALEKADAFNDAHKGLVATVLQHGDIFNIVVSEKNSRTHMQPTYVKEKLKIWDVYKQAFNSIGVDIENMPKDTESVFNPNYVDIAQYMRNLQRANIRWLTYKDALILLSMDVNSPQVQRLVGSFGSLEDAAQAIYDMNHNPNNYTSAQIRLAVTAINQTQQMQGLDLSALQSQVSMMSFQVTSSSPEEDIRAELHRLKKKYGIEINEIQLRGKELKSLSQAAAKAAIQIERRIRELEKQEGNYVEGKRLEGILNQLLTELNNKRYYSGILNFMQEAVALQQPMEDMLTNLPQTGTELEKAFQLAKVLMDVKQIKDQYYPVVDALSKESLTIDESIGQTDIDNLRTQARAIKEFFDKRERLISDLSENAMVKIMEEIVGDTAPDGQTIANVIKMAQEDSTWWDYLYSVGRASNPIIGAMGTIILNAKESRDAVMNKISERIRKANHRLKESGSDSKFMYEDDTYIISDIDWKAYNAARDAQKKVIARQGLSGFDYKQALERWEEANTEDRVVDAANGRTERVPNGKYRKAFPNLTHAQLEYYNTMMQIKGEIGSYFPAEAQKQYFAPQVRRNTLDALSDATSANDVWKAIKNKAKDLYTIREDDTNYARNGVLDGEEFTFTEGNYDDTALRRVPIFYMNKVEEGELLKDFSTGLQHLAGTAINYDAMNNVAQVVEFMGDFVKSKIPAKDSGNKQDMVGSKMVKVFKQLHKLAVNTNTDAIIDGYISMHLYGEKRDPNENPLFSRIVDNLIGYTSFKGLASNIKGAFSNYLVGEFQMMIEAGAGEFYGLMDYAWAHTRLFGKPGVMGEMMDLLTNNMNSKATLMRELFDPIQENFKDKMGERYYPNMFRQLLGHDCSFIGYKSGEYLIHYVNMYAILHNQKVKLNGKAIPLYEAFEVGNKQDGNSQLILKQGVTKLDGTAITDEWLQEIRNRIRYANQSTHGSMNEEDKGIIHRKMLGRLAMNFRQWMVEHYSRRFRKKHYDHTLKAMREGYWVSVYKGLRDGEGGEIWRDAADLKGSEKFKERGKALLMFAKDLALFTMRAQTQWSNLDDMQRANVKRAHTELMMLLALYGLNFALGEPDEHKKEWWRRWWMYQTKRLILDTEASMPHPAMAKSFLTMLQSPMAGVTVANSLLYAIYGIGDITEEIKSGPHKGENRYWRTLKKNTLPFIKDIEQMQEMDTSDALFTPFTSNNPNR